MELTPAERAVLMKVRDLFGEVSITSYRVASLMDRWPLIDRERYQIAFDGLVRKGLLVQRPGEHMFGITVAGLRAMV